MADVQAAIDDGSLAERHWLDAKAMIRSTDGARKETARDIASFANDGGGLLIGIAEEKETRTLSVNPVELAGLAEQIDQIARYRCDPPLYVVCHPLADPANPTHGVMLVEVPPSPSAPHAVEGVYYGRGDTTRHHLQDSEVARLHALRASRQLTGEQLIAVEIARNPVAVGERRNSHLFVVAHPLSSPPDLLTDVIESSQLHAQVLSVETTIRSGGVYSPSWHALSSREPRAEGVGFYTHGLSGRQYHSDLNGSRESRLMDLEISDDGEVTLFCGRASDVLRDGNEHYILDRGISVLTRGVLTLAGRLGADAGYAGRWLIAVGVTDLRGKYSSQATNDFLGGHYPAYSADTYQQATEATTSELLSQPGAVTRRLLRRLYRALGTVQANEELITD